MPFKLFEVESPEIRKSYFAIWASKQPNASIMYCPIKIWPAFRLIVLTSFVNYLPLFLLKVESIHINHIVGFLRNVPSIHIHFALNCDSRVRIDFGNSYIWFYFAPFIGIDVVDIDQIIREHRVDFTAKEVNGRAIDYGSVRFKFYGLSVQFIIEVLPPILFTVIRNINAMEVSKHTFIGVEASMDVKFVFVNSRCMVRSRRNVFALNFDLSPAGIKGVL